MKELVLGMETSLANTLSPSYISVLSRLFCWLRFWVLFSLFVYLLLLVVELELGKETSLANALPPSYTLALSRLFLLLLVWF